MKFKKSVDTMINSFDVPTTISPDMKNGNAEYEIISLKYSDTIDELKNKYGLTRIISFCLCFYSNLLNFHFQKIS